MAAAPEKSPDSTSQPMVPDEAVMMVTGNGEPTTKEKVQNGGFLFLFGLLCCVYAIVFSLGFMINVGSLVCTVGCFMILKALWNHQHKVPNEKRELVLAPDSDCRKLGRLSSLFWLHCAQRLSILHRLDLFGILFVFGVQ